MNDRSFLLRRNKDFRHEFNKNLGHVMAPRRENGGRAQIVAAARKLFSSRGFHQTAMSELAMEAAISVGQIYRLFDSKSEIIAAIVQDDADKRVGEFTDIAARVDAGDINVYEAIRLITLNSMDNKDEALSFEILAEAHRSVLVEGTIGALCQAYRSVLRNLALRVAPQMTVSAQDAAEELLLACIFGLGHRALSQSKLPPEEAAKRAADMIYAALQYGVEGG
jgi:TetR/AcrR family transcriptional repressor of uid operon